MRPGRRETRVVEVVMGEERRAATWVGSKVRSNTETVAAGRSFLGSRSGRVSVQVEKAESVILCTAMSACVGLADQVGAVPERETRRR